MTAIHTFPVEWYDYIVSQKYPLRSLTQISNRMWGGGVRPTNPHTQLYLTDITFRPFRVDEAVYQDVESFFARMEGRSGVVRIAHASRLRPYYDRSLTPTTSTFSDGSTFTDGSGFDSGYLPPEVFVATAAARGATFITLGGFPVSTANVLRRGDPFEIKPNGIPATFPHRYCARYGGSSDASGLVGFDLDHPLRAAVAAGDVVSLRNAASLFHMTDDTQFEASESDYMATIGGSLVEALDLVP